MLSRWFDLYPLCRGTPSTNSIPAFSAWGMVLYTFSAEKNTVKIPIVIVNRYV